MKFEFLDITPADVCFLAYGESLNKLFENSALAMFSVMINTKRVKPEVKRVVEVKGEGLQSLMFNWLNELLFYYGAENLAFSKFAVRIDENDFYLRANCFGEQIDPDRHELRTEVKACTYHRLEVEKVKGVWKAQVILDI